MNADPAASPPLRPLPPRWRGALVAIGAPMAVMALVVLVLVPVTVWLLITGRGPAVAEDWLRAHTMLVSAGVMTLLLPVTALGLRWFYPVPKSALGVAVPRQRGWLLGVLLLTAPMVLLALALGRVSEALLRWLSPDWAEGLIAFKQRAGVSLPESLVSLDALVTVLLIVVLAPLVEEFIFRGLVFHLLRGKGVRAAIIGSALIFSALHIFATDLLSLFAFALLLGWLRERSGSLAPCIALHATYNGTQVLFAVVTRSVV